MFVEKENFFVIEEFEKYGVKAIYTKKQAGNMSDFCNLDFEEKGIQEKNRLNILKELGIENKMQVFAYQTHSNNIKIIENDTKKYIYEKEQDIDGFITKRKDVAICTFYADCLPLFVYDMENKVIGVAHSGWLGPYKEMLKSLVEKMEKHFFTKRENILLGLGIGISQENYEVGEEFYEKFINKFGEAAKKSFLEKENKYYFDNTEFNRLVAIDLGILEKNIIISKEDTYNEKFHSHRREREKSGRAMGLICFY